MDKKWIEPPTAQHPIVQSYVDIFVGGALELEKRFSLTGYAEQIVASTDAWSNFWVNDRIMPYRPFSSEARAAEITRTLIGATTVPGSKLTMAILASVAFPHVANTCPSLAMGQLPHQPSMLGTVAAVLVVTGMTALVVQNIRLARLVADLNKRS
eukprot:gnl/TRDRNA2_/TRDRNA2_152627_c0_seq1.p2 gnl/TRDRNA2_/TRDRNA2_152627_c0~~gnl/TRDRNA2_/TRDRNA2_152627_c0_seq1.p2  ORF type:complete len:155 (+),score=14.39 gnl/TRDRNA2_/TRDRNA2_152627_c0_seq1:208-672(+)